MLLQVNLSRNAFFRSRSAKNIFFDIDIVVKYKWKCGLAWSVLLLTRILIITVVKMLWTHKAQLSESTTNKKKNKQTH